MGLRRASRPGERWCLCASRWLEAYEAGCAPEVVLGATHARALEIVPIELLTEPRGSVRARLRAPGRVAPATATIRRS